MPVQDEDEAGFAEAHRALVESGEVQFRFAAAREPAEYPDWLRSIGRLVMNALEAAGRGIAWLFSWVPDAPYARIVLYILFAGLAAAALWLILGRLRSGRWTLRPFHRGSDDNMRDAPYWQPAVAPARTWLEEAEALAAQGKYAEAVHHLLLRSVDDIARRRPDAVRPALTSRDLAQAAAIPPSARSGFARIAALVERSLFGGRGLDVEDWEAARTAYARFALPDAWQEP